MKIKTIEELALIAEKAKKKGKKIVLCHGVFDLLHPGHIKHFQAAKKFGDLLFVTVTKDEFVNKGPGRPVFSDKLRAESIAAIECVDFVAINNWPTAVETIKEIKPDVYAKGSDYFDKKADVTGKIYEEERAVKEVGGSFRLTDEISFSSSSLINAFLCPYPEQAKIFLSRFKTKYTPEKIISSLMGLRSVRVLVIGDIIIDEYHYCLAIGKSQKDSIIATKYINEEIFAGGVLSAANHLAGFCKNVAILSIIGTKNNYKDFILSHLKPNINKRFYFCPDYLTVVKRRFVDPAFLNKIFEVCYLEEKANLPPSVEDDILLYLRKNLKNFDMVLVTDFGHGFVTPKMIDLLCKKANFLAVNVQANSANFGFNLITKFPRADYICIDEPEIRLAFHDRISNLEKLILELSDKMKCRKIVITRGHLGSISYGKSEGFTQIPVFSQEIVDRIGAGDAYISVTSPCVFKGFPMELVGFIGNAVGAMKILIVGHRSSIEPESLFKYITALLK